MDGPHQIRIDGFRSYDEAFQYARELYQNKTAAQQLAGTRGTIISKENLELIGSTYSYKDYDDFYAKHFAPLTVSKRYLLSEPAEVTMPEERDLEEEISRKVQTVDDMNAEGEYNEQEQNTFEISVEEEETQSTEVEVQPAEEITIPTEEIRIPNEEPNTSTEEISIPEEVNMKPQTSQGVIEIPVEAPKQIEVGADPKPTEPVEPNKSSEYVEPIKPVEPTRPTEVPQKPKEDVIYFDDFGNTPATPSNKPQQKLDFNIEDEYYDLDGF